MENQLSAADIRSSADTTGYKVEYMTIGEKTTICLLTTQEGFEIVGTSACIDPRNFDIQVGRDWAFRNAIEQLERYQGYARQLQNARAVCSPVSDSMREACKNIKSKVW
jgi:hypothetical protein